MDDRADATEITDEEIDRLIAEVTDECDIGDAADYDVVSEFDDVLMAVDSTKVESVAVKDDVKDEKPKADRVGPEKSVDSANVKTKQVESTDKADDAMPKTTGKDPEIKRKDEISPVATAAAPSVKEKVTDGSKAAASPGAMGKPQPPGGKGAGNAGKKVESPAARGKDLGAKEAGNKEVKKTSAKVIEKNAGEKEVGNKSKPPEKTSKTPDRKEVGKTTKDVRSPGVKGGKEPGKKLDAGDKTQTVKAAASVETTGDASGKAGLTTAASKKDVTNSTAAAAADSVILNPIATATTVTVRDDDNTASPIPDPKVTDIGEEVGPKSKDFNVKVEQLPASVPEENPTGTKDLETAGVRQAPALSSEELPKDVSASSSATDEKVKAKGLGKVEEAKQMPDLLSKELTEDVGASSAATDEEVQIKGHQKEKPDEKDSDKSKAKQSEKKKGGWGWNNIGSWGSNVLNQVGDSLYHVLETVESSLVEPEETSSTSDDNSVQQPKEKENIVQLQPSTLADGATADTSDSSTPLVQPETQSLGEDKQGTSVALTSSESREAILAAADALLLEKNEKESAAEDGKGGKSDHAEATGIQKEKKKSRSSKGQSSPEQSWFSGWGLSTITGAVQQTGKRVVSTGLDVLENIGKKTMSVLADEPEEGVLPLSPSSSGPSPSGSPKKKNKSTKKGQEKGKAQMLRKCFDDCQGLAHFEALTDLSQVSQEKLDKQVGRFSGDHLVAIRTDLTLIRDASDLGGMDWEASFGNTEHDFCQLVRDFVSQLSLTVSLQKLFTVQENATKWLTACHKENAGDQKYLAEDIHKMAILMLADFTATGIAQFHKIAQLLLVDFSTPLLSYKFRALSIAGLTKVLCTEIWIEARLFTECLNQLESKESGDLVMSLITNLTLEASNCSSCLQDGYHLLLPVIQLAALKVHPLTTDNADIPNLEGLQMTSSMSQSKVAKILSRLSSENQPAVKNDLAKVENAFDHSFAASEIEDDKCDEDFSLHILESLHVIGVDVTAQKLLQAQLRTRQWLTTCEQDQQNETNILAKDIHQRALQSLHDLTLCSVELFHQIAQVVLLENPREVSAYAKRAEGIKGLARAVCLEVGFQSSKFTKCLTAAAAVGGRKADEPAQAESSAADGGISDCITPFVTNVYLEASNSTTYIQDGFQLLLPIVQLALVKAHPVCAGISN